MSSRRRRRTDLKRRQGRKPVAGLPWWAIAAIALLALLVAAARILA